jgi:predicted aspartyl protease
MEPIADDAVRLTVPVRLNGHGPFQFIVDTGADGSVIADDLVNAAGLARGAPVLVRGVTRSTVTDTAVVSRLLLGSIERRDLVMPALPRQVLEADGYLGLDVIDGHRVTFDFKNKILTVGAPRPRFAIGRMSGHEERVAARGASGHLRFVNCLVDGVRATAFIDTGAQVSACNLSLLHALMRRKSTQSTRETIDLSGVTGGKIQGAVTSVDKIQLESLALNQCALVVADFEVFKIWGLSRTPALLIGMNLLASFAKVSIDYGREEIGFELGHSQRPQSPVYAEARPA